MLSRAIRAGRGPARYLKACREVYCLCCLLIPQRGAVLGGKGHVPWLPPAGCLAAQCGWGVGAVLLSAHHLAPERLCLGKRPLPGLNYGGNNPGHTEAITAPYKSICFGLKSDLLPTLWRGSDSVRLWFLRDESSFSEIGQGCCSSCCRCGLNCHSGWVNSQVTRTVASVSDGGRAENKYWFAATELE